MEITNIKAKDFCCFDEFDIPIANNGLVWVSGVNNDSDAASSNGSGKSTIFKALVWGLYGNTIDGEKGDNVIRAGCKKATVSVELAGQEGTWVVRRVRKKGSTKLELQLPNGETFKTGNKELQQKVIDLLGLDFLAFRNTVLYGQNDINRFTNTKTTDADRKEMLHCILRSSIFSACRDLAKTDKKRIEADIADKETSIGQLDARMQEYDVDKIRQLVIMWDVERKERSEQLEGEIKNIEDRIIKAQVDLEESQTNTRVEADMKHDVEQLTMDADNYGMMADDLEGRIRENMAELDDQEKELGLHYRAIEEEARDEREALAEQKKERENELYQKERDLGKKKEDIRAIDAKLETEKEIVRKSIQKLDGDTCPVCNTALDSSGVEDYRTELFVKLEQLDEKLQKAEHLRLKVEEASEKISEVLRDVAIEFETKFNKVSQRANEVQRILDERLQGVKNSIKSLRDESVKVREYRDKQNEVLRKVEKLGQELKLAVALEEAAKEKLDGLNDMLIRTGNTFRNHLAQVNPHIQQLAEARSRLDEYSDEAKSLNKLIGACRRDLMYAEFWDKGFSNQGVASYVLDSVMPYLTERANYYLDILADGDIKVLFSTQKELKSSKNEYRDKIDITWMIEGQETSYPPSGGQAKKIEIATDLALMDLVTFREGHNTNILILDEVLDGLDDVGRQRVLRLLQEVNKFRNSVFVISHDTNMSEVFESYITVEKNEGVSHIKHLSIP